MADNKKYKNKTIAPLWKSKYGGYYTYVKDEAYDALQGIGKGDMLQLRVLADESRTKETSPHAYLEYIPAGDLAPRETGATPAKRGRPPKAADDI